MKSVKSLSMHRNRVSCTTMLFLGLSSSTFALETSGYLRTGIGASQGGKDQACYQAQRSQAKPRLGNECETYIELGLMESYKPVAPSSATFRGRVNLSLVSGHNKDWESTQPDLAKGNGADFTLALREAYIEGAQLLSPDSSAKVWVGKRFYRRQDIHMLDYYFLNNSGPGAGVEDFALGDLRLHLALLRNTPVDSKGAPAQNNFDVRLTGLSVFGGSLEPVLIYGAQTKSGAVDGKPRYEAVNGWQAGVIYGLETSLGRNMFVVQYGKGVFGANLAGRSSALNNFGGDGSQAVVKGDSKYKKAQDSSSTLRLINQFVWKTDARFSGEFVILYQDVDFGGYDDVTEKNPPKSAPNLTELTLGARPVYYFNDNVGVAFEAAHTKVENAARVGDEFKASELQKYTIAPVISPSSNYWSRPQLRLFTTYAKWKNHDEKTKVAARSQDGWSSGIQIETWW